LISELGVTPDRASLQESRINPLPRDPTIDFDPAAQWLRERDDGNGKLGVVGFCLGRRDQQLAGDTAGGGGGVDQGGVADRAGRE
jgi:dienelactone hydrolase